MKKEGEKKEWQKVMRKEWGSRKKAFFLITVHNYMYLHADTVPPPICS